MKRFLFAAIGAASTIASFANSAIAGPAFAYSWLTTDRSFDQCIVAAKRLVTSGNYVHFETTRFGVTGETANETLFVNCEDKRHVSLVLMMRSGRPTHGDINRWVALMEKQLEGVPVK
jgi:hypothetical protein